MTQVMPLVWESRFDGDDAYVGSSAKTVFPLEYWTSWALDEAGPWRLFCRLSLVGSFGTEDEAKAAAQADFDTRIRSALIGIPGAEAEAEAERTVGVQAGPIAGAILDRHGIAVKLLWREALADPVHGDRDIEYPDGAPHRTVALFALEHAMEPLDFLRSLPVGTEITTDDVAGEPRKRVFNAFTYATRTGVLERLGYGKYRRIGP